MAKKKHRWPPRKYYVYAIVDEREKCIVYVGMTNDIKARMYNHWSKKKEQRTKIDKWFAVGSREVSVAILAEFRDHDWTALCKTVETAERAAIRAFSQVDSMFGYRVDLLNMSGVTKRVTACEWP